MSSIFSGERDQRTTMLLPEAKIVPHNALLRNSAIALQVTHLVTYRRLLSRQFWKFMLVLGMRTAGVDMPQETGLCAEVITRRKLAP